MAWRASAMHRRHKPCDGQGCHHHGMTTRLTPPFTAPAALAVALRDHGHAVLTPAALAAWADIEPEALDVLRPSWNALPPDAYLRDGGRYRRRRHSCFVVEGTLVVPAPPRAHWQPVEYNALHGGLERWFEPIDAAIVAQPAWTALLRATGALCSSLKGAQPWFDEAHQFRIDTT